MFALSQKWRWIGVLALVMMGFTVGCASDEDAASSAQEADAPETAGEETAEENVDGESMTEDGGEGSEEVVDPDEDEPDVAEPDVDEPDVDSPDVAEPDVDELDVAEPDVDELDVAEPDVDEPDVAEPDVAEPDVDEADVEAPDPTELSQEGMSCLELIACGKLFPGYSDEDVSFYADFFDETCAGLGSEAGMAVYSSLFECSTIDWCNMSDSSCLQAKCGAEWEACEEQGPSGGTLFSCPTEACSANLGEWLPEPPQEDGWFCSFDALTKNEPKFHGVQYSDFDAWTKYTFKVQTGYPCRKLRFSKKGSYVDNQDDYAPFSMVSECELKPPEYFESCTAALVAWSEGDKDNPQTLESCVDPNTWFGNCQSVSDFLCPVPVEPGEEGEDCGN